MTDKKHEEIYDEARKALRTVKSCNPLDWDGPSAHEAKKMTKN